jgi:hypothetical protein
MGWLVDRTGLNYTNSFFDGGYTLVTPIGGDSVYLLNEKGLVAHYWSTPAFQPGYGYLLPGGHLLVRGQPLIESEVGAGQPAGKADILLELDWEGKVIWRWEHPFFHHDMCRLPNGNTLVLVWQKLPEDIAKKVKGGIPPEQEAKIKSDESYLKLILRGMGVGGRPRDLTGMLSDSILEISSNGEVVNSFNVWEHCDLEKDVICPLEFRHEWTHSNAVEYTPDGEVFISCREISTIFKISWPEGKVLWKWGQGILSHQHDPTLTPDGNALIFDNGTHHPITAHTRIVEVDINANKIVWQYLPKTVFGLYSGHIGGCERLSNGNTLICEGESGRVLEVTPDCEVCWEWVSPFVHNFKGVMCSMIFRAHRYKGDGPELRGQRIDEQSCEKINVKWGLREEG